MSRTWKEIFQLLKSLRTDNLDSSSSDTPLARDRKGEKFIRVVDQAVALQERTRQALEMQKKATIAHLSFDPPSHFDHDEYDTSNVHLNLVARFYGESAKRFNRLTVQVAYLPGTREDTTRKKSIGDSASSFLRLIDLPRLGRLTHFVSTASNSSTGAFGTTSEGFPLLALTPSSSTQSVVSEHEECNLSLIFHALDFVEIVQTPRDLRALLHDFPVGIVPQNAQQTAGYQKGFEFLKCLSVGVSERECMRRVGKIAFESARLQFVGADEEDWNGSGSFDTRWPGVRFVHSPAGSEDSRSSREYSGTSTGRQSVASSSSKKLPPINTSVASMASLSSGTFTTSPLFQTTRKKLTHKPPLELTLTIHILPMPPLSTCSISTLPPELLHLIFEHLLFTVNGPFLPSSSPTLPELNFVEFDWRDLRLASWTCRRWFYTYKTLRHIYIPASSSQSLEDMERGRSPVSPMERVWERPRPTTVGPPARRKSLVPSRPYGRSIAELVLDEHEYLRVDPDRPPGIGHLVQRFSVDAVGSLERLHGNREDEYWHMILSMLEACPNLTYLEIYQHPNESCCCPSSGALLERMKGLNQIQTCTFGRKKEKEKEKERGRGRGRGRRKRWRKWKFSEIAQCMNAWSDLRGLKLVDVQFTDDVKAKECPDHQCRLHHLALIDSDLNGPQLEYLLKNSVVQPTSNNDSLHGFEVVDCPNLTPSDIANALRPAEYNGEPVKLDFETFKVRLSPSQTDDSNSLADLSPPTSPFWQILSDSWSLRILHLEATGLETAIDYIKAEQILSEIPSALDSLFLGFCPDLTSRFLVDMLKNDNSPLTLLGELNIKTCFREWEEGDILYLGQTIQVVNARRKILASSTALSFDYPSLSGFAPFQSPTTYC
ncbi:hypothetical protein BT69DRAFT_1328240 [Atractiella rhizophila]|nr:hypothetical protein BT69DRAFT_1328240 [Atractiella rhizophila]